MSTGIFGSLAYDPETIYTMISEEDMRHSSIFQRLMEQPLTEARQEALQEGRELGARENAIDNLIEVLDARFDNQEVNLFKPTFEAITDLQLLRELIRTAAQAATFDTVIQTLRGYRNNGA